MIKKTISNPINLLIIIFSTLVISMDHIISMAATHSWSLYLPLIAQSKCTTDVVKNGNFEQDGFGWFISSSGMGWKEHDLIGSVTEGFSPFGGVYAARLGGYEGVLDVITQTITIPSQGRLTYWWKMGTYEILPHHDTFEVMLLQPDGTKVASLAFHDDQDFENKWQQEIIDVSIYEGGRYNLLLSSYNDNYYFSWFDVDEIHMCGTQ